MQECTHISFTLPLSTNVNTPYFANISGGGGHIPQYKQSVISIFSLEEDEEDEGGESKKKRARTMFASREKKRTCTKKEEKKKKKKNV